MNVQVENVLQMAQIEKGELTVRKETVNMHEIIEKAVELILCRWKIKREKSLPDGSHATARYRRPDASIECHL